VWIVATLGIALQWLVLVGVVVGLGSFVSKSAGRYLEAPLNLPARAWVGLAVACLWLYLIHLVVPLDSPLAWLPLLLLALAGTFFYVAGSRNELMDSLKRLKHQPWLVAVSCASLLLVLAMANQALLSPVWSDTYLYHLPAIDFYSQYRAIPGLANLHDRLGFQSSTLLIASAADVGIWKGEGFRLVNGFFLSLLILEVVQRLIASIDRRALTLGSAFMLIAASLLVALDPMRIPESVLAAPNLDVGAAVLFIVAMTYFVDAIETPSPRAVFLALTIASLSATFRPVNLLTFAIIAVVLLLVVAPAGKRLRWFGLPLAVSGALLAAGVIHTTVLSGYPFFPFPHPYFGFDWSLPQAEAQVTADSVTNWARFGATGISESEWIPWFKAWLSFIWQTGQVRDFAPAVFSGLAGLAIIALSAGRSIRLKRLLLLLSPVLPALVVWFYSAPDLRFAFGPLIAAGALPLALVLATGRSTRPAENDGSALVGDHVIANPWAMATACLLIVVCWGPAIDQIPNPVRASGDGVLGSLEPGYRPLEPYDPPGDWIEWAATEGQECVRELRCTNIPDPKKSVIFRGDGISDGLRRLPTQPPE
jgi:hypothetical protein